MFARALFAFLALPGGVAGLVPLAISRTDGHRDGSAAGGIALLVVGMILLLWCVRDFYVVGKGTLAPWDPPKRLVVVGLYRFVRNPMYIAVLTVVAGWSVTLGSIWLGAYDCILAMGFHVRVRLHEEPSLKSRFGADWDVYSATVRRWLPRVTPLREVPRT